jgi:hypothetical protein
MDDARFDAFSRTLGRVGRRRGLLKALTAVAASVFSAQLGVRTVSAIRCRTVADCPEPPCKLVSCEGHKCVFERLPGCCTDDEQCDDGDPCTRDRCDLAINRCQHTPKPEDAPCGAGKFCQGGRCRVACDRLQERCTRGQGVNNSCCQRGDAAEGLLCRPSPFGDDRCCRPLNHACQSNSDCCGSETQTPACRNGECCYAHGSECTHDDNCCGDGICRGAAGTSTGVCCQPEPKSTTCQGKCGKVTNNCGQRVTCDCCHLRRACDTAEDCCQQFAPTACRSVKGSSQSFCCRANGYICGRDSECCGAGVCRGTAGNGRCCQLPQGTCHRHGDCCGQARCENGRCCEPNTGAACNYDEDCCGFGRCEFNICR